ncbi:MAG: hypothetical protein M9931_03140 [Chitinophagales bacterium]|nr:hypothetical protein [Chitinophagales bacterium]MCO5280035.1 hypothetical protein [Chitinophagales bacterium]OJV28340.1 MAG: hypothetical protein BGO32_05780 [Bacteroidetes bacterium 37-13]HRN93376.1 hypothetical protein [Chitinophagales bacterium]HRP38670.1 hypothetical protein [Chitinophagales bacterium]
MKKVLSALAVVAILVGTQSCKKCGQCSVNGTKSGVKYCEKDNQTLYDAAKLACEAGGSDYKWVTE